MACEDRFDVQWRRPNDAEILECHDLTAEMLAFRIRAAIRSYGSVELLSLTLKMGRLNFICDICGVQQYADGICINCGANGLRAQTAQTETSNA